MWVYLLIAFILIVAFGPLLWLRPNARERRLSTLRQRAYQEGMRVEVRHLPGVDVAAEARVTAGGRELDTRRECAAYRLPLPARLKRLPAWRLLRGDTGSRAVPGWGFEVGRRPNHADLEQVLAALAGPLAGLPEDVMAVECDAHSVAGFWLEGPEATPDSVADMARHLAEIGAAMTALEARLAAGETPGKI